ncbi:uncharacterized protein LOC113228617 [Hyposmocoma kahamanoa]|uniref:uncharacterized protein LOC113228617 n=1 Tax=Hyposmocoma kahamanoa TaxID=1477025 RepID=UPI000E6D5D81|nr:uncharacterized protein LOC113228617 [Hyposmocoma kahamanoa]
MPCQSFIQEVFCGNLTELIEDDSYQECPISLFRRKRANLDYTRWRANVQTTPEFIVKVLDEEVTTSNANQIVAVNILPVTQRVEKIIVGGAMVPPPMSTVSSADLSKDYTRFVPPTTLSVTQIADNLALQLKTTTPQEGPQPISPPAQSSPPFVRSMEALHNPRRDESPPASPQFISRFSKPKVLARQYAPIAPVAFTRRSLTPLTPSTIDYNKEFVQPTRSTFSGKYQLSSRTFPEERTSSSIIYDDRFSLPPQSSPHRPSTESKQNSILTFVYEELRPHDEFVSRTTLKRDPSRTPGPPNKTTDLSFSFRFKTPNTKHDNPTPASVDKVPYIQKLQAKPEDSRGKDHEVGEKEEKFLQHKLTTVVEKELDINYNNLFYNDEYKEVTTRRPLETSVHYIPDEYDDKSKYKEINSVSAIDKIEGPESNDDTKQSITEKDVIYNTYNHELEKELQLRRAVTKNISIDLDISTVTATSSKSEITATEPDKDVKKGEEKRQTCSMLKLRQLNFNSPRTLSEIVAQLKQWAEDSPVAKWIDITDGNLTTMENPIHMIIVDDPSNGQIMSAKQTVMIVAGIQGRDHHAVTAAMYVLYQLVERSEFHADVLTKYRFWIIPVFNPDGYDYSMTFPHRREWTKNLRQTWDNCRGRESCKACETFGLRCTIQPCYGVNLDRNFEYQWIPTEELQAEHPCGLLYAGERQLSEAETLSLTHFLHDQRFPLYTFIAFKEGDVLGVMYPYSHTRKKRAFDHVYRQRASRAAAAAYSISGRPYVAGQTSEFLPLYAGGIEDWVDSHVGIDNTYTIMMFRPTDSYNMKLITEHVVHEAYAAIDTLLMQSSEVLSPPSLTLTQAKASRILPMSLLFVSTILQIMLTGYK